MNLTHLSQNTSKCTNCTEDDNVSLDAEFNMQMVYVAIGCVGMSGNLMVMVVIMSSSELRKATTNIFICNQSAIDFSAALFIVLTSLVRDVHAVKGIIAKEIFCRLWMDNFPIWGLFVSSTYNLLAITMERYSAIVYPLCHMNMCSRGKARFTLIFTWLWGLLYNLAYMVPTSPYKNGECTAYSEWPSPLVQSIVGMLTIVVQYFLPLALITFAYIRIIMVLMRSFNSKEKKGKETDRQDAKRERLMNRARKNTVKTLLMISVSFILCWSPNQIIYTMYNLGYVINFNGAFYHFTVIAVFLNCCINPFIYALQYDQFKKVLFKRCRSPQEPSTHSLSEQPTRKSTESDVSTGTNRNKAEINMNKTESNRNKTENIRNKAEDMSTKADIKRGDMEFDNIGFDIGYV